MRIFCLALFVLSSLFFTFVKADDVTIRVAILDSPNMPPKLWSWLQYERAYLRGLDVATFVTKKQHIKVIYKNFFYGDQALDILNEIPKVKAWHPDLILGPHYSNQFLLLKHYFKDTLVLSSYASDDAIYDMPANFYSLFPPDIVPVQAIADFISTRFHDRNVLIINRSDCKDCNDMSALFTTLYKKINPTVKVYQNNFVGEVDDLADANVLLKGYTKGDVIVTEVVNLYNDIDLITRLTPFLGKDPVFVSQEDNWGNPNNGLPISLKLGLSFRAYLVNPLYFDMNSKNFRIFTSGYLNLYGAYPNEIVSYVTFMTLTSATEALNSCRLDKSLATSIRQRILMCYLAKLHQDPNWFRPRVYAIYRLEAGTGELVMKKDMTDYFPQTYHDASK